MKTLDEIRIEQGRRQDWLANQIGVKRQTLGRWAAENGEASIKKAYLIAAAKALGIEPEEIKEYQDYVKI